jgi:hypothetical protein
VKRTAWFWIATQIFLLPLLLSVMASASPKDEEKQITVRVRNYPRVDSGVLLKAETTANKILQEAGADTVWLLCFDGSTWSRDAACTSLPGPLDLTVNVLSFPASQASHPRGDAFGYATEDGEQGFGCDAWIFYDPMKRFAVERELSLAQLLGHVFAHEVGHMLLGANSHSGMGLMRAQWSGRELQAADHGGLFFSASESKRIQKVVLVRWQAVSRGVQRAEAQQITENRLVPVSK